MSWFVGLPMGWWYIVINKGILFEVSHQPILAIDALGGIHLLGIWRGLSDVIKRYVKLVLTKLKHRRVCLNIRKQFYCEGDWGLAQVAQGGCKVFILGDTQKLSGHNSGKPAVGSPAWAEGWTRWPPEVPSKLGLLWFYIQNTSELCSSLEITPNFLSIQLQEFNTGLQPASAAQCCYGNNWLSHGQVCHFHHQTLVFIRTMMSVTKSPLDLEPPAAVCCCLTDTLTFQVRFG